MDSHVQDLETVRVRLERLEVDSRRLTARNRAFKGGAILFLVALLVVLLARPGQHGYAQPKKERRSVEANLFRLLDRSGTARAVIGMAEFGPSLVLLDEKANLRGAIALGKGSSPLVVFRRGSASPDMLLARVPGNSVLLLQNSKGLLGLTDESAGASLSLMDNNRRTRLLLTHDIYGSELSLFDANIRKRLSLTLEPDVPRIKIIGEKGDLVSVLPTPEMKADGSVLAVHQALVPPDAIAFITANTEAIARTRLGRQVRKSMGLVTTAPDNAEFAIKQAGEDWLRQTHFWTASGEPVEVVTTTSPYDRERLLKRLGDRIIAREFRGQPYYHLTKWTSNKPAFLFLDKRTIVQGNDAGIREVLARIPAVRSKSELTPLWDMVPINAVGGGLRRFSVSRDAPVLGLLGAVLSESPDASRLLADSLVALGPVRQVAAQVEFEPATQVHVRLFYPDADRAAGALKAWKRIHTRIRDKLTALPKTPDPDSNWRRTLLILKELEVSVSRMALKVEGREVSIRFPFESEKVSEGFLGSLSELLMEGISNIRRVAARSAAMNDLKQIGLAIHNYASFHSSELLTSAIYSKDGKPLLSWRVAILPFIEQDGLYTQFKLDEPWDSPHNKKLLAKMPKTYAPKVDTTRQPYSTYYRVFTGPDTLFDPKLARVNKGKDARFKMDKVPDGTANTILLVEAAEAVPWTKPDELVVEPKKPLPKLGGQFREGFLVLMLDGSVRLVNKKVTEKTLRNAINPNDGEALGADW
jgi:hypothetical protein